MTNSPEEYVRFIQKELRFLRLEDSLLLLSRVLAVSRGEVRDPDAETLLARFQRPFPDFAIHLLAKYLLQVGRANTTEMLDWNRLNRLIPAAIQLAIADPLSGSSNEAVGGFLLRMMSQQLPRSFGMQSYGLAIGLFQDLDVIGDDDGFNVRAEVEQAIKMPAELFMRLGVAAMSAGQATFNGVLQPGTLNFGWLQTATAELPGIPWLEKWLDFAKAVSCTQVKYNELLKQHCVSADESEYLAYEFNPLRLKPIIQTQGDHYICLDHRMLLYRTSWGIFQDGYVSKRKGFSAPFGGAFEKFVGNLLRSVIPQKSLWIESESPKVQLWRSGRHKQHKISDYIYRSLERNIFIECKSSIRPTIELITYARLKRRKELANEVAKAIRQTIEHCEAVSRAEWTDEQLHKHPATMLVVTFGRIESMNGPFFRELINEELTGMSLAIPNYLILSIEELDSVIWLTESGFDFAQMIEELANKPSFNALDIYRDNLDERSVSSFAEKKAQRMWDFLPEDTVGKPKLES